LAESIRHQGEPLRVLIASDTFPPDINGAARFTERLAGGLVRNGNNVHVVAPAIDKNWGTFLETHDGMEMTVHRIKSHKLIVHKTLRFVMPFTIKKKMDRILDSFEPDAIHSQSHVVMGRALAKSGHERNINLIATNHLMPENMLRYIPLPKFLEKRIIRSLWKDSGKVFSQFDQVTTPTRRAAQLLEAATGLTNVLAISCGIDATKFANATPTTNKPFRVLFLGRLDWEKHIHNLLRAVAKLPPEIDFHVEIAGDGNQRKYLGELAQELKIAGRVTFSGHITEAELPLAYEKATVFAMPSIAELQSIATMEAMASGRPVIAANAMALPHLVHDGDNGYLFEPDDVDDFTKALLKVATANQKELDRLSENSLHLIQSHDIKRTLAIFEGLYRAEDDSKRETDDNQPEYMKPIGKLNVAVRRAEQRMRRQTLLALGKISDLGDEIKDGLDELRADVRRQAKKVDKQVRKGVKKTVTKAKEAIRRLDE
jgi:glycosyltransferase involved in cell wall biosynthesis